MRTLTTCLLCNDRHPAAASWHFAGTAVDQCGSYGWGVTDYVCASSSVVAMACEDCAHVELAPCQMEGLSNNTAGATESSASSANATSDDGECQQGSLRLADTEEDDAIGGVVTVTGVVEVYYQEEWGNMCSGGLSVAGANAANVTCRELGCRRGEQWVVNNEDSDNDIVLDGVVCNGDEARREFSACARGDSV